MEDYSTIFVGLDVHKDSHLRSLCSPGPLRQGHLSRTRRRSTMRNRQADPYPPIQGSAGRLRLRSRSLRPHPLPLPQQEGSSVLRFITVSHPSKGSRSSQDRSPQTRSVGWSGWLGAPVTAAPILLEFILQMDIPWLELKQLGIGVGRDFASQVQIETDCILGRC